MELVNALATLSRHELLVQYIRLNEDALVQDGVLDADAVALLVEEVLALADVGRGD